jgi:Domain of unknown function (DUF4192)
MTRSSLDNGHCRIRLTAPSDVLAIVPYLLGFQPSESVVMLLIRRGRVALTVRVDLPAPGAAGHLAAEFGRLAEQHHARELILVGYGADADSARKVLGVLAADLEPYGLGDVLYADGRRWWSLRCTAGCCPADGRPYDLSTHPIAATAVYAGLHARANRPALAAEAAGPLAKDHDRLRRLAAAVAAETAALDLRERQELLTSLVREVIEEEPDDLTDRTCVQLAVLTRDPPVRDVASAMITMQQAEAHRRLWSRVVRRTLDPYQAAPLCLLGLAAWVGGDGALLNCCIDRIEAIDPRYPLGRLLTRISKAALPPSLWDDLLPGIRAGLSVLAR